MQAAGRENPVNQDGANAASIFCTRTSINENLVRYLISTLSEVLARERF